MEEELSEPDGDSLAEDFVLKENSLLLRKQNSSRNIRPGVTLFEMWITLTTGPITIQWIARFVL